MQRGDMQPEQYPDDREAMAADDRFRRYTIDVRTVDDLLADTVEMVWQLTTRDRTDDHTQRPLGEVVDELQQAAAIWHQQVEEGADLSVRRRPDQQAVIEVPAE